ncbi:ribosome maturation factor RimM [Liquorilactobacillus oeni]|uniref:Ribosome maturation factor RimM n=1 Tax=Liquorilactobacillus oeni DSM 19972 TaxID=1423777 RepID=A0A0R1M8L6_9LACO|nr:ribosome maturation factor RimM [Liquorilactobacillus oeni]KRL04685.1 16S rRNA processing protein RimM [Liquorilactobacillus oeni DSM 19972]
MNYYEVGRIINTHGIKGEVKLTITTDFAAERFQKGVRLYIEDQKEQPIEVKLQTIRRQKQFYLLGFSGYDSISQVENFKGRKLMVAQEDQQKLSVGNYYYRQIVGLDVWDEKNNQLGVVKEILNFGANDIWVVERPHKKDLLLPAIQDVIKKVDLENGKIEIELLDGLDV